MQLIIQTINWENGDETNFPSSRCPEITVIGDEDTQEKVIEAVRRENKTAVWSSIVAVILPD